MVATLRLLGLATVLSAAYAWYLYTDFETRGRALVAAATFAVIESVWLTIATTDVATGATAFRAPTLATLGHSSFCQFWANVLYTPLLLDGFRAVVPDSPILRVALFPLNVWLLEIVEVGGVGVVPSTPRWLPPLAVPGTPMGPHPRMISMPPLMQSSPCLNRTRGATRSLCSRGPGCCAVSF
jgi:hypothetical protein